ncbi:MAG: PAS domain-containing protein [Candidatus Omnitrophica bacterium]|nr:PAS domain-containing protein [Candidatus Omnitrophota bacterium]
MGERLEQATHELRSAMGKMDLALGAIEESIIWVDSAGRIQWCNGPSDRLIGKPHTQVLGGEISRLLPLAQNGRAVAQELHPFNRALKNSAPATDTYELQQGDRSRLLEISATPVELEKGQRSVVLVTRDVTKRKQSEEVLKRQAEELKNERVTALSLAEDAQEAQKRALKAEEEVKRLNESLERRVSERTTQLEAVNRELEAFSYSISHDLEAPLRAINGFSNVLLEDHSSWMNEEGQRYLRLIRENSRKMSELINDILLFNQLGSQPMELTQVEMSGLVKEALEEVRPKASNRRIQLNAKDLPPAWGDRGMIRRLLLELISNAVKFTKEKETAVIEVGGRSEAGRCLYYVKDNGVGFDMQYVQKLFKAFQRLHSEEVFEGTGIGLAIVRRIVNRHAGEIRAEGKVGEGATFSFAFPQRGAR